MTLMPHAHAYVIFYCCPRYHHSAAISATESVALITYNMSVVLSREILVDCANLEYAGSFYLNDQGCYGGDPYDALTFIYQYTIPQVSALSR